MIHWKWNSSISFISFGFWVAIRCMRFAALCFAILHKRILYLSTICIARSFQIGIYVQDFCCVLTMNCLHISTLYMMFFYYLLIIPKPLKVNLLTRYIIKLGLMDSYVIYICQHKLDCYLFSQVVCLLLFHCILSIYYKLVQYM